MNVSVMTHWQGQGKYCLSPGNAFSNSPFNHNKLVCEASWSQFWFNNLLKYNSFPCLYEIRTSALISQHPPYLQDCLFFLNCSFWNMKALIIIWTTDINTQLAQDKMQVINLSMENSSSQGSKEFKLKKKKSRIQ